MKPRRGKSFVEELSREPTLDDIVASIKAHSWRAAAAGHSSGMHGAVLLGALRALQQTRDASALELAVELIDVLRDHLFWNAVSSEPMHQVLVEIAHSFLKADGFNIRDEMTGRAALDFDELHTAIKAALPAEQGVKASARRHLEKLKKGGAPVSARKELGRQAR